MDNILCPAIIYPNGKIIREGGSLYFLTDCATEVTMFNRSWTRDDLGLHIHQRLDLRPSQKISKITYRMPTGNTISSMTATTLKVRTDEDVRQMFYAYDRASAYFHYIEVMVEVVDRTDCRDQLTIGGSGAVGAGPSNLQYSHTLNFQHNAASSSYAPPISDPYQPMDYATHNTPTYENVANTVLHVIEQQVQDIENIDEECEDAEDDPDYNPISDDDNSEAGSDHGVYIRTSSTQKKRGYSAIPFMRRLNLGEDPDDVANSTVPVYNPDDVTAELELGMTFADKESLVLALKQYCLRKNVDYLVKQSESEKYAGVCKNKNTGCQWRVRARKGARTNVWKITKYEGPHTCNVAGMTVDHRKLDSDFICSVIMRTISDNPATTISQIISFVDQRYQYQPTYKKAWIAKQKAITKIFGDWDASYGQLPRWLLAMQQSMPGNVVSLEVKPAYYANGTVCDQAKYFGRLFWTFQPCVQGFAFCKPIVQIDGTHLFGRYKGTLLIAVTQDGNNNVYPLAFALVESENDSSWRFFVKNLREHVCTQENLCIISDRHDSIGKALADVGWVPEHAVHRFCIRHFAANYHKQFKDVLLRKAMTNAGYAATKQQFRHWYGIAAGDPERKVWLDRVPLEKWTQLYDGNFRFGQMTTNLVECINNVLKGTRHLPITALVMSTYYRLTQLFDRRGVDADTQATSGHRWSQHLIKIMAENQNQARNIRIVLDSRRNQEFTSVQYLPEQQRESIQKFKINLHNRTCSCGMFQIHRYPCAHAYAAIASQNLDWATYVSDVYRIENLRSAYAMDFVHIGSEDEWPGYYGATIIPDPETKRSEKGRPKTSRIRTEMDIREESQSKRCGLCRQEGHFRNNCPNKERYLKK